MTYFIIMKLHPKKKKQNGLLEKNTYINVWYYTYSFRISIFGLYIVSVLEDANDKGNKHNLT